MAISGKLIGFLAKRKKLIGNVLRRGERQVGRLGKRSELYGTGPGLRTLGDDARGTVNELSSLKQTRKYTRQFRQEGVQFLKSQRRWKRIGAASTAAPIVAGTAAVLRIKKKDRRTKS